MANFFNYFRQNLYMNVVLRSALLLLFSTTSHFLVAQEKYAVLVAVDQYFIAPNVKSDVNLAGCVNDANSIQGLLTNRFGFDEKNVFRLYNAAATKKNFYELMKTVYRKCKAGDVVVLYFSGHGVWMSNQTLHDDSIKRGKSQAIAMSDLYAPGWDCLVSDETLKHIANQYIDKKIVFTSIFDCCFGGKLYQNFPTYEWELDLPYYAQMKDLEIDSIPYRPVIKKPVGCHDSLAIDLRNATDEEIRKLMRQKNVTPAASGKVYVDSDFDDVPDCADWEVYSPINELKDSMGICRQPSSASFFDYPINRYTASDFRSDSIKSYFNETTRAYNLKDAISVDYKSSIRPNDRKDSRFLSLSATSDIQKAHEVTDITGQKHGAFTAALLSVYRGSSASLPISELKTKIAAILQEQGHSQTPFYYHDPNRIRANLIGVDSKGFSDRLLTTCVSNQGGLITFDKGLADGVTRGNFLRGARQQNYNVQILTVTADRATAKDESSGRIKAGDIFKVIDDYTITDPYLKVYVPTIKVTPKEFESFVQRKVDSVIDPVQTSYDKEYVSIVFVWESIQRFQKIFLKPTGYETPALLPLPSYIANPIIARLKKNQNIEIVSNIDDAKLITYLSYSGGMQSSIGKFEIFFQPRITANGNVRLRPINTRSVSPLEQSIQKLQVLSTQLDTDLKEIIRKKTKAWINPYPRR